MRKLVWPLGASPAPRPASLLVFVPALGSFLAPDILGGGKKLMIGSLIQQQFTTGRDWSFGAALSMILMAFVLGSLMWSAWRRRRGHRERLTIVSCQRGFDWRRMPEYGVLSCAGASSSSMRPSSSSSSMRSTPTASR